MATDLENSIGWLGTCLSRYSFDFKCILPDERKLTDADFNEVFYSKEELDKTLWVIEHQAGMYHSRGDLDNVLKKVNLSIDVTLKMPDEIGKIRHMDNLTIALLQKLILRDHRFKIYLDYWKKFAGTIDKIYQVRQEELSDADRILSKLEDFKVGDKVEFIKEYDDQMPIECVCSGMSHWKIPKGTTGIVKSISDNCLHVEVSCEFELAGQDRAAGDKGLVTVWVSKKAPSEISCLKIWTGL